MSKINADQIDLVASELEAAGTSIRQLSIKAGGVTEAKLGFSWETVDLLASAFSYDGTRSTSTLTTAASANANVLDNAELLRNGVGAGDRVTPTAATGDWSLSGTALSVHGDITATGDSYTIRYVVGTSSGPGTANGNMIWLGTVAQQPLQAESDYFNGAALDTSKWEEWDILNEVTVNQTDGEVRLTKTAATVGYGGIVQDMPADDQFVITARVNIEGRANVNHLNVSLFIGEDLSAGTGAPSTNGFFNCQLNSNANEITLSTNVWNTYNSFSATLEDEENPTTTQTYLRWFVDRTAGVAGEVTALVSVDGRKWLHYGTVDVNGQAAVTALVSMGLAIWNQTGAEGTVSCDVFRVDITTDKFLPVGGYVGTSVPSTFLTPRDVVVAGNSTLDLLGWTDRRAKLIKCEVLCTTVATVGAYTLALHKDPNVSNVNMLSAATFDLTTAGTLSPYVPTDVPLTSTADDLIMNAGDVWEASFVSDNAGLDAAGVYFQLTWLVL